MYHALTGPITASDADADDAPLFGAAPAPPAPPALELPDDLTRRGFTLIVRAPNAMFAVSKEWGCTGTKGMIGAVIREARGLVGYCEYRNSSKADE